MPVRVAINGFRRVGRSFLRAAHEQRADLEVVAVNDLVDTATLAHLLKYDSVFGRFPGQVGVEDADIVIDGSRVRTLAQTDPLAPPWDELGIDVVRLRLLNDGPSLAHAQAHIERVWQVIGPEPRSPARDVHGALTSSLSCPDLGSAAGCCSLDYRSARPAYARVWWRACIRSTR
jgi:glyceraldehyde-3-phosphate dehydrogenase/erythrose-4-phosphate dehydrogenase